jgi:hypothetical protein
MKRIAGRFARSEPRRRVGKFVRGLLADLPRTNCWTVAEWAGEATPDGMQHLLERAKWDAERSAMICVSTSSVTSAPSRPSSSSTGPAT